MHWLREKIEFPNPRYASKQGLLAAGGDLSTERLLFAYRLGIFPWYNAGEPVLWWSPDPRFVLFPKEIKVSKSMRRILRKNTFKVTYDTAFARVIGHCATVPREGQEGTWLQPEMEEAYTKLHEMGYAHSVETWLDGELVGGLYGVALGKVFYGESMFAKASNASKVALMHLAYRLRLEGFVMIDCQAETEHLGSLGARFVPRNDFLDELFLNLKRPAGIGHWTHWSDHTWQDLQPQ